MAGLWDLAGAIAKAAFGEKDPFHNRSEADDLALQRAGEKLIAELNSGKYDAGLAAAAKGNVGDWRKPSFRSLLADYRGPLSAKEAARDLVPVLLNASAYNFTRFVEPEYPQLAKAARIQGRVELDLILEPATGAVLQVTCISGHPILKPSAIEAAKQWRFKPERAGSGTIKATLEYSLRCLSE